VVWADLRAAIRAGSYQVTKHAQKRMIQRGITLTDVEECVRHGKVLETRRRSGQTLVHVEGPRRAGDPIHVVIKDLGLPLVVTVFFGYEPWDLPEENGEED
jgi:hypothetical protein